MVPHQRERQQHLARKTANQCRCKTHKTVSLDKFVKIDAKKFHGDTQVISEVEMLGHLDDMVFLLQILDRELDVSTLVPNHIHVPICEGCQEF